MELNIWDIDGETLAHILEFMTSKYVFMFFSAFNKLMRRKLIGAGGLRSFVIGVGDVGWLGSIMKNPDFWDLPSFLPNFSSPILRNLTSFSFAQANGSQMPKIPNLPKTLTRLKWYSEQSLFASYPMEAIRKALPALVTLDISSIVVPRLPSEDAFSNAPQGLTSLSIVFMNCSTESIAQLPASLTKLAITCRVQANLPFVPPHLNLALQIPHPNIIDLSLSCHVIIPKAQYFLPPHLARLELDCIAESEWKNLPATLTEVQINRNAQPNPSQCQYPANIKTLRFVNAHMYECDVLDFPSHLEQLVLYDIVYDYTSVPAGTEALDDWSTLDNFWNASKPDFKITLLSPSPMRKLNTSKLPPSSVVSFEIPNHGCGRAPLSWPSITAVRCSPLLTPNPTIPDFPLTSLSPSITRLSFDKNAPNEIYASAVRNLQHLSDAIISLDSSCMPKDSWTLSLPGDAEACFWKNFAPDSLHLENVSLSALHLLQHYQDSPILEQISIQGSYKIQSTFLHFVPPLAKLDLENATLMPNRYESCVMTLPNTLTDLSLGGSHARWILRPSDPVLVEWFPKKLKLLTINAKSGSNNEAWSLPRLPNLTKLTIKAFYITAQQIGSLPSHLNQIVNDESNHQVTAEGDPGQNECSVM